MEELSLAQYVMINWTYGTGNTGMDSSRRANRSVIFVQFTFQRTLGFYFLQIYIPLTIIVMSSWVSFWLVKTNQVSQRYWLRLHFNLDILKLNVRVRRFPPEQVSAPPAPWLWSPSGLAGRPSPRSPTPLPSMYSSSSALFSCFLRWLNSRFLASWMFTLKDTRRKKK